MDITIICDGGQVNFVCFLTVKSYLKDLDKCVGD